MSRGVLFHVYVVLDDRPDFEREIGLMWPAESAASAIERALGLLDHEARYHVKRVDVDPIPYEAWLAAQGVDPDTGES